MLRSPQTHHIKAGDLLRTDMVTIVHRHRYNVPLYLCEHKAFSGGYYLRLVPRSTPDLYQAVAIA